MALAAGERAQNQVRAIAEFKLEELKAWLVFQKDLTRDESQKAYLLYAANQIKRFQDDPKKMNLTKANDPPDGQPIGMDWWSLSEREWCDWRWSTEPLAVANGFTPKALRNIAQGKRAARHPGYNERRIQSPEGAT